MWNIIFLVTCVLLIGLLSIAVFSKEIINSEETHSFKNIIIASVVMCLVELLLQVFVRALGINSMIVDALCRAYLISLVLWYTFFSRYVFIICLNKSDEKRYKKNIELVKKVLLFIGIVSSIVMIVLPLDKYYDSTKMYTYGLAVDALKVFIGSYMIVYIIGLLKNFKHLRNKKYLPIFVVILLLIVSTALQTSDPSVLIASMIATYVCYTMYFTIENPDMKMLNEMSKNKELMEQGYEDKYNFLFEMTQEARNPLVNMNNLSNALRMEEDPQKIKDGLITLNNMVRQLDFSINNILNISSLDISKIKVVDNKYDLAKMCHDLEVRIKPEMNSTVNFNLTMPKQIPTLVGDYMKIRQILYSLLINSCKNTENGTINMKVNLIEKYDVARLVFNISDTGRGMSIEKINEILSATGSLSQQEIENLEKKEFNIQLCQKVIKIMGGNLMIKSNVGEGTEIILTIDQKVYHEKDNSILTQYENTIANYRKVLIVSQNKNKLGIIKKKLTDNHITYSNLYSGADAIDRIKAGKKYDFILVDDEMTEMSGFMTLKGMKEINGFNTPVIVMLKEDKENIKEHYLDDGFSDYVIIDNLESELDRIIEKY